MSKLNVVPAEKIQTEVLNQAVLSFKEIKAKIAFLENEKRKHQAIIEDAASNTADGKIITDTYKISLAIIESEKIDKDAAKAALGEALKPFLSKSVSTRLTVN